MIRILILIAICFSTLATYSQNNSKKLSKRELKETISQVTNLLKEKYVFPDKATKMTKLLNKHLKKGTYNSFKNPKQLAEKLTKDLQSITNDKHLRVFYSPKSQRGAKEITAEQRKKFEQQMVAMEKRDNFLFKEVKILDGNIGYIDFRGFRDPKHAGETVIAALSFLQNTDAIILDLRNNGGGYPQMVQLIASYFVDDEPVHLNTFYNRVEDKYSQYWTLPYVPGKRLPNVQLYILTGSSTFSAAEEFSYDLKHLKRAILVGETTGGGAHPGESFQINDKFKVWTPTGRAINPITKTNWEGVGVIPHIKTTEKAALVEAQLKALDSLNTLNKDPFRKGYYKWHIETLNVVKSPVKVPLATLKKYVGTYSRINILLEDDTLYYQSGNDEKLKLTPINQFTFQYRELTDVRMIFSIKNGEAELTTKNVYGRSDVYKKNKN